MNDEQVRVENNLDKSINRDYAKYYEQQRKDKM